MNFIHPLSESIYSALLELQAHDVVRNVSVTSEDNIDRIYATYLLSIPQHPKEPGILDEEPVVFEAKAEDIVPNPYFQREGFPRLPHLLRNTGVRKSPCLYTAKPEQLALQWNAFQYVHRVGEWLEKVSDGTLHHSDQALEDIMLIDGGKCIISPIYRLGVAHEFVRESRFGQSTRVFHLERVASQENNSYKVVEVDIGYVDHSAIVAAPNTLEELGEVLLSGSNRIFIHSIIHKLFQSSDNYDKKLFFLLKAEINDKAIDKKDERLYAFITEMKLGEIGDEINVLTVNPETYTLSYECFISGIPTDSNLKIPILGLTIHENFSFIMGRFANGLRIEENPSRILQIGVGAIGSQIARNLTQSGFACGWICMDDDVLLPHNLSRFIIPCLPDSIGKPKVDVVSNSLNGLFNTDKYCEPVNSAIGFGKIDETFVDLIRKEGVIVVDTSASVSVQRTLDACLGNSNERFTSFLSPNGKSICLFSTKIGSLLTHTMLEVYFYASLISDERLANLLKVEQEGYTYSGDSCRAISARISTHDVSMFSAIASSFIEEAKTLKEDSAILLLKNGHKVDEVVLPTVPFVKYGKVSGKDVFISPLLLEKLTNLRKEKLPNETGGVLLGTYDIITDSLYIVDHILAPIDSTASPTHFHRGVKGVDDLLDSIKKATHNQLGYIGEWHSHPDRVPPIPSSTDEKLLQWLRDQSRNSTYPFLMLIQGDRDFTISV
jgi:hypothetical protein